LTGLLYSFNIGGRPSGYHDAPVRELDKVSVSVEHSMPMGHGGPEFAMSPDSMLT